jgi:hypothetical protein
MVEIPIIWHPLNRFPPNNHIEFECKFKFSMKNYENCDGMVAIPPIWWPLDGFCSLTC